MGQFYSPPNRGAYADWNRAEQMRFDWFLEIPVGLIWQNFKQLETDDGE
ncbi:MAG: hypothetical protein NTY36_01360 [Deltaproteobacteria bacterium]|nr:hypothetical protein [Deltaproteobacteria bacterium]